MFFLVSLTETYYICCRKYSRIDWIGKLIKLLWNTETSFASRWRATPFGVTLSRWITKRTSAQIMSFGVSSHHRCGFFIKGNG